MPMLGSHPAQVRVLVVAVLISLPPTHPWPPAPPTPRPIGGPLALVGRGLEGPGLAGLILPLGALQLGQC